MGVAAVGVTGFVYSFWLEGEVFGDDLQVPPPHGIWVDVQRQLGNGRTFGENEGVVVMGVSVAVGMGVGFARFYWSDGQRHRYAEPHHAGQTDLENL